MKPGSKALSELKDRGINLVANALAQSADHIDSFFKMLRIELAFYIGCLNLYRTTCPNRRNRLFSPARRLQRTAGILFVDYMMSAWL